MTAFKKLETAELDEGDVSPGQLDFEAHAVAGGAEEDRLRLERDAAFAAGEELLGDVAGLIDFVAHADQPWPAGRGPFAPQVLGI